MFRGNRSTEEIQRTTYDLRYPLPRGESAWLTAMTAWCWLSFVHILKRLCDLGELTSYVAAGTYRT